MSCYVYFFARVNGNFLRLASGSRNSNIYRFLEDFGYNGPWEKVKPIGRAMIRAWMATADEEMDATEKRIARHVNNKNNILAAANTSLAEKMEYLNSEDECIEYETEELENYKRLKEQFNCYLNIMNEHQYDDIGEGDVIDPDKIIYYGVECYNPTTEDILE